MADINRVLGVRDAGSETFTMSDGAAEQTAVAGQDERYCLLVENSDTSTAGVIIKAGDGIRSSIGDLLVTVAQNERKVINLDSSRFKMLSGENAGKFVIEIKNEAGDSAFGGTVTNVKLAALQL
nr:MAG TPA: hypothetical protein [Caudoviricetes sp.]